MTRSTKPATPTPTHFTLPAILPAMITGLFILTACGGSALTNDAPIATNTQNDRCADNPLANGCQAADAGFLSVNFDEDIGNQEAESSEAPPAPKPIGHTETAPKSEPVVSAQQSEPTPVTAATTTAFTDWVSVRDLIDTKGTSLRGEDDTGTQQNQFLQDGTGKIDSTGAYRGDSLYMNLGRARYNGDIIGGDAIDGIDFYTDELTIRTGGIKISSSVTDTRVITVTRYHYAGILSGTDLGAPVADSGVEATWNGSFRTHNARNAVDFQLTVTFGGDDNSRTISAFVKDNAWQAGVNDYYLVAGNYDENGLITGTVNYGEFTGGERATPANSRTANGILRGLIGVEGAVGVFVSGSAVAADGKVTGGTGGTVTIPLTGAVTRTYGFSGGFVASASLPSGERVLYNDWFESFDDASTGGVHETPSLRAEVTGENADGDDTFTSGFLGISEYADALDERGVSGSPLAITRGKLTLADDMDSGVSFFSNGAESYAGLLAGTDLGAPITANDASATWNGQVQVVGNRAVSTNFTLDVTFGAVAGVDGSAGRVEAFFVQIQDAAYHYLDGTFNAAGIITGTAIAGGFTNGDRNRFTGGVNDGILTGLIGKDGAVGAFYSSTGGYSGGFVAAPTQ